MSDIEYAIETLEESRRNNHLNGPKLVGVENTKWVAKVLDLAIAALREKAARERPVPLTVEQVRGMIGEPLKHWVWVEIIRPEEFYHGDVRSGYYRTQSDFTNGEAFCCGWPGIGYAFDYPDYGITWLAYAHKPGGEQPK